MEHEDCPAQEEPDDHFFYRMYQPPGTYFKSERVFICSGCGHELEDD